MNYQFIAFPLFRSFENRIRFEAGSSSRIFFQQLFNVPMFSPLRCLHSAQLCFLLFLPYVIPLLVLLTGRSCPMELPRSSYRFLSTLRECAANLLRLASLRKKGWLPLFASFLSCHSSHPVLALSKCCCSCVIRNLGASSFLVVFLHSRIRWRRYAILPQISLPPPPYPRNLSP